MTFVTTGVGAIFICFKNINRKRVADFVLAIVAYYKKNTVAILSRYTIYSVSKLILEFRCGLYDQAIFTHKKAEYVAWDEADHSAAGGVCTRHVYMSRSACGVQPDGSLQRHMAVLQSLCRRPNHPRNIAVPHL